MSSNRARGTRRPPDPLVPYMPSVALTPDLGRVFRDARARAEGPKHPLVLVSPARTLVELPYALPPEKIEEAKKLALQILRTDAPQKVLVVTYTDPTALVKDPTYTRCIPFLGHLFALASAGHSVVLFEGHATSFEAAVEGVDLLLVDSGMRPFLRDDWARVAFAGMRPDGRALIHDRKGHRLLEVPRRDGPSPPNFTPHLPAVTDPPDPAAIFAEARRRTRSAGGSVVIVLPDRSLRVLEPVARSSVSPGDEKSIADIEPGGRPVEVVVLALNAPDLLDKSLKSTFPSIDLARGLAAFGHSVILFEGSEKALGPGLRGAELLLVDGGLEPHLPADWLVTARQEMRRPRIVVLSRDGLLLLVDPHKAS